MSDLTYNDQSTWINTLWDGLHDLHGWGGLGDPIPEDPEAEREYYRREAQWDDICTAMAWVTEHLGAQGFCGQCRAVTHMELKGTVCERCHRGMIE